MLPVAMNPEAESEKVTREAIADIEADQKQMEEQQEPWRTQLDEALQCVKASAAAGRQQILAKVVAACDSESVETTNLVGAALRQVASRMMPAVADSHDDQQAVDGLRDGTDVASDSTDDEQGAEEDLLEMPAMAEDEFRQEVDTAMAHVRGLGRQHGRELAARFSNTFYELNGRDPSTEELAGMLARAQAELRAEAFEGNSDQEDEREDAAPLPGDVLFRYAVDAVPPTVQQLAKSKFADMVGREPTDGELRALLVAVMASPDVECQFADEDDAADPDYNPEEDLILDAQEDEEYEETLSIAELQAELSELHAAHEDLREEKELERNFCDELEPAMLREIYDKLTKATGNAPDAAELEAMAKAMVERPLMEATFDSSSDSDFVPPAAACSDGEEDADSPQDSLTVLHRMTELFERLSAEHPELDVDEVLQLYRRKAQAWLKDAVVSTEYDDALHRIAAVDFELDIDSAMIGEDHQVTIREYFSEHHGVGLTALDSGMLVQQVSAFDWALLPPEACFLRRPTAADGTQSWTLGQ